MTNREREDAYEAELRDANVKYPAVWNPTTLRYDPDRGLREWADAQPKPTRIKGADLWWEYRQLESHTDREYGNFHDEALHERKDALGDEIKRRISANDHLFGTGELPNGDMHICPDEHDGDGPCESFYCDCGPAEEDPVKQAWIDYADENPIPVTPELQKFAANVLMFRKVRS